MNLNLTWALPILAACSGGNGEVVIAGTPGDTVFSYVPSSLKTAAGADGEVRSVTILMRNAPVSQNSPDAQIGARSEMEFVCARRAHRQVQTFSIRADGSEIVAVPADPKRPFTDSRPESFERKLADAICEAS